MTTNRTNIVVPYTLETSSLQKSMSFCCELSHHSNTNYEPVYKVLEGDKTIYRGYSTEYFSRINSIKYEKRTVTELSEENSDLYIRVYFPGEQISTYIPRATLYLINIYTYYNGNKVDLFSSVLDSYDNLACTPIFSDSVRYQEYQDIRIPDPNALAHELLLISHIDGTEDLLLEEMSNLINISIQPIIRDEGNTLLVRRNTQAGVSIIPFVGNTSIHLANKLNFETNSIDTTITFNTSIASTLSSYIHKIYDREKMDDPTHVNQATAYLRYFLINRADESIYSDISYLYEDPARKEADSDKFSLSFEDFLKPLIEKAEEKELDLWQLWEEGLQIAIFLEIFDTKIVVENEESKTEEEIRREVSRLIQDDEFTLGKEIRISSQSISLTEDVWKKFIEYEDIEDININELKQQIEDMKQPITVINTISQQTVQVNQNGGGAGVIKPVFFRAYPVQEIILHRDMKENIAVNLDEYKNKVDMFYLKLCGNYFAEYARTYDGVIFAINSNVITSNTGTYYICDKDKKFITSGKYKCE